jgi:hypothetical protein
LLVVGVSALAVAAGFAAYLRLSWIFPANSDGASNALQAWDMLHGNWLLRGWTLSDVSFWTTELPQYMLVELAHGLNAGDIHIAAAMTYTLATVLAALLATGRAERHATDLAAVWTALLGAAIAAGIMLAPQLGDGLAILLSSPDHIGTSVPVMLAWLVLDRARPRWAVTAGVVALLGWAAVGDPLVNYVAIVPLVLVCAVRVIQALARRPAMTTRRAAIACQRREIALAAGAILAAGAAHGVLRLVPALGGFVSPSPTTQLATVSQLWHHNLPVVGHGLLLLFGADFLDYPASPFTILHLVGVALTAVGALWAAWRFWPDRDMVSQLLLTGIVINLAIFLASTKVSWLPTMREADVVLPFGAALAGRQLAPRITAMPQVAATGLITVLGLAGIGYVAALAHEITPTAPATSEQRLAAWLEAHGPTNGLAGYWESNVVTLTSGNRVRIRLMQVVGGRPAATVRAGHAGRGPGDSADPARIAAGVREDNAAWYNPARYTANFVVLAPTMHTLPGFTDRAAVVSMFGEPGRSYRVEEYTVLVWPHANLLAELLPPQGRKPPAGRKEG